MFQGRTDVFYTCVAWWGGEGGEVAISGGFSMKWTSERGTKDFSFITLKLELFRRHKFDAILSIQTLNLIVA